MAKLYAVWLKTHPGGGAMPLDFANDVHHRVIQDRLAAAGKTPDNSPELFARIAGARLKAQTAKQAIRLADEPPPLDWCGQALPFTRLRTGQFSGRSMFSCRANAGYAYADVTAYATTTALTDFIFLKSTNKEAFGIPAKAVDTDPVSGKSVPSPGRILFMDSVTMAFDDALDKDFSGYQPAKVANAVADRDPSLSIEHPREIQGNPPDNPIRICLFREFIHVGPNQDCDYGAVKYDDSTGTVEYQPFSPDADGIAAAVPTGVETPWTPDSTAYFGAGESLVAQNGSPVIAYIPMRGHYDAGASNNQNCDNQLTQGIAQLFLLETGGTCTAKGVGLGGQTGGTPDLPWTNDDPRMAKWDFDGLVDFGTTCLGNLQNAKMVVTITNDDGFCGPGRGKTFLVTPIDFRNSCLAEGTLVATSSGKSVAVEKLAIGDKVIANSKGRALTIQAISRGWEPAPMVRLQDEHGRRVTVTATHPMLLDGGKVIAAKRLVAGDKVLTRQGATRLVTVDRVKHKGKVFNFVLGTKQELASLAPSEHTLFANGFLVGDSVMQAALEESMKTPSPEVASRIPPRWLEDYKHAVARKTVAER